jgi:hypothetical protein
MLNNERANVIFVFRVPFGQHLPPACDSGGVVMIGHLESLLVDGRCLQHVRDSMFLKSPSHINPSISNY